MQKLTSLLAVAAVLGFASAASATTLTLSLYSSQGSGGSTDPSNLDATITFMITGPSELTITVTNDTSSPNTFDINEYFFNAENPPVTGLTLTEAEGVACPGCGWALSTSTGMGGPTQADGFGWFDFAVKDGVGGDPHNILPGESVDFVFTIAGTGPFDMTDFVEFSEIDGGGEQAMLVAAKFANGPADASAYGATDVPEPASMLFLLAGACLAAYRRLK